jgi:putative ATPase
MDLFEASARRRRVGEPLAERMRPRRLDELVGQQHLVGAGKILSRIAPGGLLPSLILWGPPGTGKTTLARLLAERARSHLIALSAVSAGVKEVRAAVAEARRLLVERGLATVLFLDEIHRFSKSQQDALLPHVEAGTVILVGATTENPSFEVNAALLSRTRVLRLEPLGDDELREVLRRALEDTERGLGGKGVALSEEAEAALLAGAAGDARRLLGGIEVAAEIAAGARIEPAHVEEALQQRTLLYDKAGDEHYGVVSAFIKSMRGSDPDAAAYWMTRMLEAGEDPLFILRRMVIFAAEDIGNADPAALGVAVSALDAFRFVGLPEGVLPMTQAAVYLACAPKSNTALTTYAAARKAVRDRGALPVPARLRNATSALGRQMGHGVGYRYPHNVAGRYVAETYLPDELEGQRFYEPTESGVEVAMKERLERWHREAAGGREGREAAGGREGREAAGGEEDEE